MEGKKEERMWNWLMPSGKRYEVLTNIEEGTIKVFDSDKKLVNKEEQLSVDAIRFVEKNFLEYEEAKVRLLELELVNGSEGNSGSGGGWIIR